MKASKRPKGAIQSVPHVDATRLALLRGKLRRGRGTFDLEVFRDRAYSRSLRD